MIGRRNMLCGMHVHVELPGPHARVGVMTRMIPFLPLFIALATASPFWRSRPTPPSTRSRGRHARAVHDEKEFDAYVGALVKRASSRTRASSGGRCALRWPTPPSNCAPPTAGKLVEDSLAIAALFRMARHVRLCWWGHFGSRGR
jgi:glutamate---cysteine ligase / carboxylate-amine ligase